MKVKEVRTQSLSPSLPLPLPDLQLVMTFIINGKQLEVQKQATVQIECEYGQFLYNVGTLCNAKLPPHKRFNSDGIRIVFERAWVTANELKAQRKKKQIARVSFEDKSDFLALKREVSTTKNPREWYLLMDAHITFKQGSVSAAQQSVAAPIAASSATTAVEQIPQRTVHFSMNYLIVDCHNATE